MRAEDLIPCFAGELEDLVFLSGDFLSLPENFPMRDRLNDLVEEAGDWFNADRGINPDDLEGAGYFLECLFDALDMFSPDGFYFGAHPGDGSEYGWWQSETD